MAGGQSLLPAMAMRLNSPAALIDLSDLGLSGISLQGDHVTIGAMTPHAQVLAHPAIAARLPLLARALAHVAHPAIRNRGTMGGSLSLNDPAAEWPACALALGATIHVTGPDGPRAIPADDFVLGLYETALQPGEIMTHATFPAQSPAPWGFAEVARRYGDYALAGLAAVAGPAPRVVWFGLADCARRDHAAEQALASGADPLPVLLDGIEIMADSVTPAAARRRLAQTLMTRMLPDLRP
jgi:carbon-monoxide dehydrogenase medium subunit